MKHRTFNSVMPYINELWASRVLGICHNPKRGPDLVEPGKFVEVKFCMIKPKLPKRHNYPSAWTVQNHQLEYADYFSGQGFWAFGLYELDRPVKKIVSFYPEKLEEMVVERELYLTIWSWVEKFPCHIVSGKTRYSEWENHFRYPKLSDLPKVIRSYDVEKGIVHLTTGVPAYLFNIRGRLKK